MKVLILQGSPRKQGNTARLVERICEGAAARGVSAEVIHLPGLEIHPCIGCGHCEKEGTCVFQDDMTPLLAKIIDAHRIILASPVYFYGFTAQSKVVIDRCQTLWSRKYVLGRSNAVPGTQKKGYLVAVAATLGERVFEGLALTARYVLDAMDCHYSGELLIRGVDRPGAIMKRQDDLERAFALGKRMADP